jgi:hypothetical protein
MHKTAGTLQRLCGIEPGHLLNLVDDVGIVQHAHGAVPNRSSGYCVDDVTRLVIAVLDLQHGVSDPGHQRMPASGECPFSKAHLAANAEFGLLAGFPHVKRGDVVHSKPRT